MGTHAIHKSFPPPFLSAHYGQISVFFGRNFSLKFTPPTTQTARQPMFFANPPVTPARFRVGPLLESFFNTGLRFSRVEMWRGGLGKAYPLPTLSSVGASLARPCSRELSGQSLARPCSVSTSRSSNRTCGTTASGSRTRPYAFAHGRSRVRSVSRTSPSFSYRNWSGNCRVPLLPCFLCFRRNH